MACEGFSGSASCSGEFLVFVIIGYVDDDEDIDRRMVYFAMGEEHRHWSGHLGHASFLTSHIMLDNVLPLARASAELSNVEDIEVYEVSLTPIQKAIGRTI